MPIINSASPAELRAVTGSEADAKKIVENRPYKSTDELVQKKVMPKATYDRSRTRSSPSRPATRAGRREQVGRFILPASLKKRPRLSR
jgi:hypothetical protein